MEHNTSSNKRIGVILGSSRPTRIGHHIVDWILSEIRSPEDSHMSYHFIDLAEWNLPMLDESDIPAHGKYSQPHTKKWSEEIMSYDAFIFVTPQYNWGYPAVLKNALDYLYTEWNAKPAIIISYAHRGGGKAAAQLSQVIEGGLKMNVTHTMPEIVFKEDMLDEQRNIVTPSTHFAASVPAIKSAIEELKGKLFK
jgi:NAD(P)H-dependent FMN reductase